ncbi:ImmA/IrrE family metallo-endopeptidase [Paenibacillus sp. FA6]|uniref:ImmA/IrrE family metallo-endopeptidase n=1 Tax=Paenibacillus sp. FA6 TaxID=3413029 RepID=UPI003F65D294
MSYEALVSQYPQLTIKETDLPRGLSGLYFDNVILIDRRVNRYEKRCILAEELGHYETTYGDITDQSKVQNRKQELRARAWGYQKLIPLHRIIEAGRAGIEGRHDVAEHLGVTEDFLQSTIEHYQRKYGLYVVVGPDLIYFEPLTLTPLC